MRKKTLTKISLVLIILIKPIYANTPTASFNLINLIRVSIGEIIGYSSDANYDSLVCGLSGHTNGECVNGGPPQTGLVGAAAYLANEISTISFNAGFSTCNDLPSAGSVRAKDSNGNNVNLTFEIPSHTIPITWTNGGSSFQKRVSFPTILAGESAKIAFEFNCGSTSASSYVVVNMVMNNATGYKRLIVLYTGNISGTLNGIEAYLSEYNASSNLSRAANAIRIEYDSSTYLYHLWGVIDHNLDNTNGLHFINRISIAGNYSTADASVFSSGITLDASGSNQHINIATLNTLNTLNTSTDINDGMTIGSPFFTNDFASNIDNGTVVDGNQFSNKGCINFTAPLTNSLSTSYCAGLTPIDINTTVHSAPYLDASGFFSMDWTINIMPTKMEILP